ncbi:type I-B CRISPR-associated protein Cas5b [Alkaliphilus sp. B6464]|uniref:type I-B CRISPR-associated protein Cas5b n=1 Tax=Alkaliphilus sp. B6464 TaxID=2731219 RepID=UPI001BAB35C3|nr:type I-B CRISPR-associated protein Cas5b [Alkaliphilus sp. B6464]QUH21809.1 type I-B CRISPR-associated protein Cas5 [Alkaliphilus sp. B6464]
MKSLKFTLSGDFACFKRPHQNNKLFTYGNIHKVALLGILGSLLGYGGHSQKEEESVYPEFYEKLKDLKISIKPNIVGAFSKRFKHYTDTTGFSNNRDGLMVREQSLINPSWDIYILTDKKNDTVVNELYKCLLSRSGSFNPYLGKNHYPARISNYGLVELEEVDKVNRIDSLFEYEHIEFDDLINENNMNTFSIREIMPIDMTEYKNRYTEKELCFSNYAISDCKLRNLYSSEGYVLQFI